MTRRRTPLLLAALLLLGGCMGPRQPELADGPWGEGHGVLWLLASGHDVVLCRWKGDVEWSHPAPAPVLIAPNRLIYLDGTTLVAVGSREP